MKRFFDRLSIANKLVLINLIVVLVALFCAFSFYIFDERAKQRQRVMDDLKTQSLMMSNSLEASLHDQDSNQLQQILSSFRYDSRVSEAIIFDVNNKPLAHFVQRDYKKNVVTYSPLHIGRMQWPGFDKQSVVYTRNGLFLFQEIERNGVVLGNLYVHSSQGWISDYLIKNFCALLLVFLVALGIALLVMRKMMGIVTEPVKQVLQAVNVVLDEGNYSVRVRQNSSDELGDLTRAFNNMLQAIGDRDTELSKQHLQLEAEVQERTHELRKANESLENTVRALQQANRAIRISEENKRIAEASAKSKAHFLANMSHELRTPMNGVLGMLSLMNETRLDEEQRDYLNVAYESGHVLLELINNVLDLSKIEQGKLALESIEFDLRNTIEDVYSILAGPADSKSLDLILQWPPQTPMKVEGDPTRFKQLVCNLVANAIKFTAQGRVTIQFYLLENYGSRKRYRFEVQDTGIGIREDVRDLVFEKFSQADISTTREFGGTGLGLALCKQFARLMDGSIGVDSVYGKGSTFWFEVTFSDTSVSIPLVSSVASKRFVSESIISEQSSSAKWLILEPSKAMYDGFDCYLNALGLVSERCDDSRQVVKKLSADTGNQYQGVILCLSAGVEEVESLIAAGGLDTFLPKTKILLCGTVLQRQALAASNKKYEFITKPLRMERLREAVLEQRSESVLPAVDEAVGPNVISLQKYRVLVVEDNQVNQKVARGRLEKLGYNVAVAENGAAAIELHKSEPFDLIFMDCQMPVLDGFQATRRIRQQEQKSTNHIPIIAMTAHALAGDRDQCIKAGMDDYVAKPFKTEELKILLERWL